MADGMKASEVLSRAADLIEPEGAWTQGVWARNANGWGAAGLGDAVCFCAYGAIAAALGTSCWGAEESKAGQLFARLAGDGSVADAENWNDSPDRTQAEVVAALRQASELARSEGA